jgi:hypothetical protein
MKYRWSPIEPVFGEISEILAEKKNPDADLCTEDGSAVDGGDDFRSEGMVRSP